MDLLPLFHNLQNRVCLVVGGGKTAVRKVRLLDAAGARVRVIALDVCLELLELERESPSVVIEQRRFEDRDIAGQVLIIAATSDAALNRRISNLAQKKCIPVNVVDAPELCTVVFPSIIDRSPVQIAISTGGSAPVLARLMRARLESLLPAAYGKLAILSQKYRAKVRTKFKDDSAVRSFWESVFEGNIAEAIFSGRDEQAEQLLEERLDQSGKQFQGAVYLVGAGPGDPDLLTFRALRLMQQADIVLYDRLVSKEILDLVRRDAERRYVGKTAGDHPVSQEEINWMLVDLAQQGKKVLRLKGGDPFIFGRGGEEIDHLAEHQIAFQIVPGITAASGCASYAGIPLTHRDYAQSVRFVAGHLRDGKLDLPWNELAAPGQTLVFYMGLIGLETICRELIRHGASRELPAALIEKGTTPHQKVHVGTLENLPEKVRKAEAKAPTLIIVGGVVNLHDRLAWFGKEN